MRFPKAADCPLALNIPWLLLILLGNGRGHSSLMAHSCEVKPLQEGCLEEQPGCSTSCRDHIGEGESWVSKADLPHHGPKRVLQAEMLHGR